MNAESSILSQSHSTTSRYVNTTPTLHPSSGLSDPVKLVITQEHKDSPMHDLVQSAQIGQQITQILLKSPEPQTWLVEIARALGESFRVETCLIVAGVNQGISSQRALWRVDEYSAEEQGKQAERLEQLMLSVDLASANPLPISDLQVSDSGLTLSNRSDVLPARAVLRIFCRFQSSINGMIVLGRSQPYEWTAQEQKLLTIASESVAIAISQLQLTRQVLAASRYQTLLNQLSLAIRSDLKVNEILQMALANTAQALQVNRGLLLLLKGTNPVSKRRLSRYFAKTEVTVAGEWFEEADCQSVQPSKRAATLFNQSFLLSESPLCQQAFRNAPNLTAIADRRKLPTTDGRRENLSVFDQEILSALLIVPLVGSHTSSSPAPVVLGFLVFQNCHPHPWDKEELELVTWVSTQVSATLIQNQTLQQVQSLVEERTVQLERSIQVQAKLYEKTRQQIDQLQQLNQLKDEFLSSMSHELRTPLTTMSLAIRMLRQPNLVSERREKYLEILEQQCNQEIDLINDLLSLQRLESNQAYIQPQTIDLMSLIKELAQSFEQKWADKRLILKVDCPERFMFDTDPDSLHRILLELLTNAGKYSDPNTTVELQVTPQVQQSINQVVITLSNTGSGISPTDLNHIFDKFHRGQGVTKKAVQGTGLGLALVKCLVQHLNGTIDVKSDPSENSSSSLTTFTLTFPQFPQQQQSLNQELIP